MFIQKFKTDAMSLLSEEIDPRLANCGSQDVAQKNYFKHIKKTLIENFSEDDELSVSIIQDDTIEERFLLGIDDIIIFKAS